MTTREMYHLEEDLSVIFIGNFYSYMDVYFLPYLMRFLSNVSIMGCS